MTANFNGIDGPYLINNEPYTVNQNNTLTKSIIDSIDSVNAVVNNETKDVFPESIQDSLTIPKSNYPKSEIIISICGL